MAMTAEQIRAAFRAGEVSGRELLEIISDYVKTLEGKVTQEILPEQAHATDLELLAKFAKGNGGRRTGRLMGLGYIKVEVTAAGYAALGLKPPPSTVRTCDFCGAPEPTGSGKLFWAGVPTGDKAMRHYPEGTERPAKVNLCHDCHVSF